MAFKIRNKRRSKPRAKMSKRHNRNVFAAGSRPHSKNRSRPSRGGFRL